MNTNIIDYDLSFWFNLIPNNHFFTFFVAHIEINA